MEKDTLCRIYCRHVCGPLSCLGNQKFYCESDIREGFGRIHFLHFVILMCPSAGSGTVGGGGKVGRLGLGRWDGGLGWEGGLE